MAGHSQFKNIMYRKGAQDKKRAKVFTKIIRELVTSARSGLPDPAANPRLRAAVLANSREKILELGLGKRRGLCGRKQRCENKCRGCDGAHERI